MPPANQAGQPQRRRYKQLLDVCLLLDKFNEDWEALYNESVHDGIQRTITQMYILPELNLDIAAPDYIAELYKNDKRLKRMLEYALKLLNQPESKNLERSIPIFLRR